MSDDAKTKDSAINRLSDYGFSNEEEKSAFSMLTPREARILRSRFNLADSGETNNAEPGEDDPHN